jgi:Reverse transcriptase (RNA-dependent DNA polymerase)/Endonuclease-reverse transcriptase
MGNKHGQMVTTDKSKDEQQEREGQRIVRGRVARETEEPQILEVLYTNAQSLPGKLVELAAISEFLSPDIILITETWTNKSITNAAMTIPGYRLEERKDRTDTANGIGGGLAVYIKEKFVTMPLVKEYNFNQYTGFKIKTLAQPLSFILIYRPPSSSAENTSELCNLLTNLDNNSFIIGDFNLPGTDWENAVSDSKGRAVLEKATEEGLEQLVDFATHNKGNRLDLVFTNCSDKVISVTDEGCIGKSDHTMILLKIETQFKVKTRCTKIVCWKKGRYENIRGNLALVKWHELLADKSTEEAWQIFKEIISIQVESEIPSFIPTGKTRPKWLTTEVQKLLTQKKKAWRKAKSDGSALSRAEYEEIAKQLKKKITAEKKKLERELANDHEGNGRKFRNYIKQRTRSRDPVGPLTDSSGATLTEDSEIAEELNKFFASIFTREDRTNIPAKAMETENRLDRIQLSRAEVTLKLRKLRPDSAAGPDNIHPKLLVECAEELAEPLCLIFRRSLSNNEVPADWKTATVAPIFKKGKRTDPGNYRPVSLTSVPCKVLESIIKDNVMRHLMTNNLLKDSQHGFMPNRSCTTNLIEFMETVTMNVDKGRPVDIFYLDFSKAFDSVPHERLMIKLQAKGVGGEVAAWLRSWLTGRTQKVRVGEEVSTEQNVESGVPQGTVMGPWLFDV